MFPDPKSKTGRFGVLFNDIRECKNAKHCPELNIRQFYYEPNGFTISFWNDKGLWREGIDHRVVFVCESPGPSAAEGTAEDVQPCYHGSHRDRRFQEVRRKYDFENCFITNTVKCGVRRGAQHSPFEIKACRGFLLCEIDLIRPQVIVGVGGNAYRTLRKDILSHLKMPPIIFKITHYSSRRNPMEYWDKEFPELIRLLDRLRPWEEWANDRTVWSRNS